jgi:glycosyltransferase involved in cell wall biosynthesis
VTPGCGAPAARIDQALPAFSYGDAIGNHALALRAMLRRGGAESEIFASSIHPLVSAEARPWREYAACDDARNVCILHFSIGADMAWFFSRLRSRRVLVYHNITPPAFARGVNRRLERECRRGQEQLRELAAGTDLAIGVSEYNRGELAAMGFTRTAVLPVSVDFSEHDRTPDSPDLVQRWRDGRTNILHVGRLAPNKRIEDIVRAFDLYRRVNPASRLLLVGNDRHPRGYAESLQAFVVRLGTPDVHFLGHLDFSGLCTCYRLADLYLSLSEHEGFCVPLLEAMHFRVPIVAYAAGAIPETLGGAGLLVRERRFEEVAELMDLAVTDAPLRARLLAAGAARLEEFAPARIERELWALLERHGLGVAACKG